MSWLQQGCSVLRELDRPAAGRVEVQHQPAHALHWRQAGAFTWHSVDQTNPRPWFDHQQHSKRACRLLETAGHLPERQQHVCVVLVSIIPPSLWAAALLSRRCFHTTPCCCAFTHSRMAAGSIRMVSSASLHRPCLQPSFQILLLPFLLSFLLRFSFTQPDGSWNCRHDEPECAPSSPFIPSPLSFVLFPSALSLHTARWQLEVYVWYRQRHSTPLVSSHHHLSPCCCLFAFFPAAVFLHTAGWQLEVQA